MSDQERCDIPSSDGWVPVVSASNGHAIVGPGQILELDGSHVSPITVTAVGSKENPALIRPVSGLDRVTLRSQGPGIILMNPSHVIVRDVDIIGHDSADGIVVWAEHSGSTNVTLERISVTGAKNGISIGSAVPKGLTNIRVTRCAIFDCLLQGILTYGPENPHFGLSDVVIEECTVEGTRGDPTLTDQHSGSGIVMGSVNGGEILSCIAKGNGALSQASEGPEGIFLYDCHSVTIRMCTASKNRTGGPADGGGFGIDIRCEECSIEDCRAEENDGAGILLWNWPGMIGGNHTILRNTLSHNCQRTTWHGEITIAPSFPGVRVSHNHLTPRATQWPIVIGRGHRGIEAESNIQETGEDVHPVEIDMFGHP